ncbi:DUF262 domain-containing protein [Mucilaginibacter sp.]|uniref:DUF262 domain-containing protein n=1 Tax=Mucilaginibacter sp. TaxID=1882438 RepID=UPI00262D7B12|nr:DUF262 domain-containing protein [Mucilaginibacter sp.]
MTLFNIEEEEKVGQETEEDLHLGEKQKFGEAVLWATDWTTETIISQLKKGNIELSPSFQRRDAWGPDRKSRFIESLILGLPIPQIILAERKDKKGSYLVIDGKQRLLSIRQFCADKDGDTFDPLILSSIEIVPGINGKTHAQIVSNASLTTLITAFENQSIRTVIIKNWPNQEFLYTVFLRLNGGSLPLSPQELRQALNPGKFIDFADELSISSIGIKKVLRIEKADYRMRDTEIIVRYFAFINFMNKYNGNLKDFLDKACEKLNKDWDKSSKEIIHQAEQLELAISCTFAIFGDRDGFSKYSKGTFTGLFNRPIFDIMTYYFSDPIIRESALNHSAVVKQAFIDISNNNPDFLRSLETSTKNTENTAKRFSTWGEQLKAVLGLSFPIPQRAIVGIEIK